MAKTHQKILLAAVITCLLILMVGCEENTMGGKKHRLIAAENIELNSLLAQQAEKIKQQKKQLAECKEQRSTLSEQTQGDMQNMAEFFLAENRRLTEENAKLKAELAELKAVSEEAK